jgi:LPXTG-motif cell wall-anchored protein
MKMTKNNWLLIVGLLIGALGGFLYYKFWGCNGSCAITSSPWRSMGYGALMGVLLFMNFQSTKKDKLHV